MNSGRVIPTAVIPDSLRFAPAVRDDGGWNDPA